MEELSIKRQKITIKGLFFLYTAIGFYAKIIIENNLCGGYTKAEMHEMDEYAKSKGVELVPVIQTLVHLTNLVKIPHYQGEGVTSSGKFDCTYADLTDIWQSAYEGENGATLESKMVSA